MSFGHHDLGSVVGTGQNASTAWVSLSKGTWLFESTLGYQRFRPIGLEGADALLRSGQRILGLNDLVVSQFQLHYAATNRLVISARVPYTWARVREYSMPQVHVLDSVKHPYGLNDVSFMATWQMVRLPKLGISLVGGLELPSGQSFDTETSNLLVTGSGSYDPLLGVQAVWRSSLGQMAANAQYRWCSTTGEGYKQGSASQLQLWYISQGMALRRDSIEPGRQIKFNWSMGLSWQVMEPALLNQKVLPNSGFERTSVSLGFQWTIGKKWMVPVGISLPITQKLGGEQSTQLYSVQAGFSYFFIPKNQKKKS